MRTAPPARSLSDPHHTTPSTLQRSMASPPPPLLSRQNTAPYATSLKLAKAADDDEPEICAFNLRGRCAFKDKCNLFHAPLSYQWQYQDDDDDDDDGDDEWVSLGFKVNKQVEEAFCTPGTDTVTVTWKERGVE